MRKEITAWPEVRSKFGDLLNKEHPEVIASGGWELLEKRVVEVCRVVCLFCFVLLFFFPSWIFKKSLCFVFLHQIKVPM
jgi:hypothetical protein